MGRVRALVVVGLVCTLTGLVSPTAGARSAGPKSPGPKGGGAEAAYLTSLCAGPRSSGTFEVNGATASADLACDAEHDVAAIEGLAAPRIFSDCAGQGSWRPGNIHPCPYGSVGLEGVGADSPTTFGWDEDTAGGTPFAFDASVIRFRTAAGGVVLVSQEDQLVATHLRLYLHAFPDGQKFTTDPDDPDLQIGCAIPSSASVTLRIRADTIPVYVGKGDRADTRGGPVAHISVGDVVLVPADGAATSHVTLDVETCSSVP